MMVPCELYLEELLSIPEGDLLEINGAIWQALHNSGI
jgi:hypothetical protein